MYKNYFFILRLWRVFLWRETHDLYILIIYAFTILYFNPCIRGGWKGYCINPLVTMVFRSHFRLHWSVCIKYKCHVAIKHKWSANYFREFSPGELHGWFFSPFLLQGSRKLTFFFFYSRSIWMIRHLLFWILARLVVGNLSMDDHVFPHYFLSEIIFISSGIIIISIFLCGFLGQTQFLYLSSNSSLW